MHLHMFDKLKSQDIRSHMSTRYIEWITDNFRM